MDAAARLDHAAQSLRLQSAAGHRADPARPHRGPGRSRLHGNAKFLRPIDVNPTQTVPPARRDWVSGLLFGSSYAVEHLLKGALDAPHPARLDLRRPFRAAE